MKFQAANSMAKLAEQAGAGGGAMGMGLGAGFGMMMPGMIQQAMAATGGTTTPAAANVDPRAAVRGVATAAGYVVAESPDMLQITVPVGPLRKQVVNVEFTPSAVNYWSVCGPYDEKKAPELLRYNSEVLHGALAVKKVGAAEMVVLQANQAAGSVVPVEISRTLSALAWQADQMEQKLSDVDQN
jgi:hypothetical protein